MQIATKPKTLSNNGVCKPKSLVVIDFGNGEVKALIRHSGATKFKRIAFPSHVAQTEQSNSDCLRILNGKALTTYLVGEPAASIPMSHTGRSESGKADNAKLLLLHTLRQAFGTEQTIHCNIIFTSPSNKTYGTDISERLQGTHTVTVPADAYVIGSEAKTFSVIVHRAAPQLEGHYAFSALKLKSDAWIVDCGNRTLITTKVAPNGRILKRAYFGGAGVQGMAERITAHEALAAQFKEHTPKKVMDFILSDKGASVASEIAPAVSACAAEAIAFIDNDDAPKHLIGGGANIPGLAKLFDGKVAKDAQWINIKALAAVSDQILGA